MGPREVNRRGQLSHSCVCCLLSTKQNKLIRMSPGESNMQAVLRTIGLETDNLKHKKRADNGVFPGWTVTCRHCACQLLVNNIISMLVGSRPGTLNHLGGTMAMKTCGRGSSTLAYWLNPCLVCGRIQYRCWFVSRCSTFHCHRGGIPNGPRTGAIACCFPQGTLAGCWKH